MSRESRNAIFASAFVLLVIVMGAVESGPLPSLNNYLPSFLVFISPPSQGQNSTQAVTSSTTHSTTVHVTSTHTRSTRTTRTRSTTTTSTTSRPPPGPVIAIGDVAPYLLVPLIVVLAGAMGFLLLRRETPRVFTLKKNIEELEVERAKFTNSWSRRIRNAALLKYYLMMTKVCAAAGIENVDSETPHEFIGRVSTVLNVDEQDANVFADVVDKAHYGEDIDPGEVTAADSFMSSFTQLIAKRLADVG